MSRLRYSYLFLHRLLTAGQPTWETTKTVSAISTLQGAGRVQVFLPLSTAEPAPRVPARGLEPPLQVADVCCHFRCHMWGEGSCKQNCCLQRQRNPTPLLCISPFCVSSFKIWHNKSQRRCKLSLLNFQLGFASSFERFTCVCASVCLWRCVLVHLMLQLCLVCNRHVMSQTGVRKTLRLKKVDLEYKKDTSLVGR